MEQVISRDGTPIAYYRHGEGSPLVLVHGTGATDPTGWPAFSLLAERFRLITIDRRGRGESGDSPTYAIEREFEDVAAVVDAIGEPVDLLGHSFGGILAFEAALLTGNVRKLVVYEGAPIPEGMFPEGITDRLQALVEAGDLEGALTVHYRENVGMSPGEIAQFKSSPAWPVRLASAHTVPRELKALERYEFDADRFKDMQTPTLLLVGGDSPQFVKETTEAADSALPNSRIVVMPGQQHIAMYTSPDLFVGELDRFLCGSPQ